MTLREQFEQWITAAPIEASIARRSSDPKVSGWPGQYSDYKVQLAWEAWREGYKAGSEAAEKKAVDGNG